MDAVLLSYMDPNRPEVSKVARDSPLVPIQDSSEHEVDVNGPNGIPPIVERGPVRTSKSSSEAPQAPEADMDSPDGISLVLRREENDTASKSSSEDLVNTAQNALHTMAGHFTGVSLDPSVVGSSPQSLGAPREADVAGNLNDREAHIESGRGNDPSNDIRTPEHTSMDSDSRFSGEAVDALVSLKEQSPKVQAHRQVEDHVQNKDDLAVVSSISGRPNGPIPATDGTSPHTLPTISSSRSPVRQLEAGLPLSDKPKLPPLRSHILNQLAEVAEQESVQCLDGRNGSSRPSQVPLAALGGTHRRSTPPDSTGHAPHDFPRIPLQYMTVQQRQQLFQAQPPKGPNGPFALSRMSPASSYDETSPQDPFRRSREVAGGSSASPEPNHTSSHPYYLDRRPSQASEKGPPYSPALMSKTPYPTPPMAEGGTFADEGFHRSPSRASHDPRQTSQDHQMDVDPTSQPVQKHTNSHAKGVLHRCPHPGCTAAPFQTQYLLKYHTFQLPREKTAKMTDDSYSSHANVHSQVRPHHCPVKGCPRGVGGKGFKRKNEMIRHGLVHTSPGYICPFCQDKEHRYPRPDNLLR